MELGGSLTERGDLPVGRYCPIERVLGTIGNRSSMVLLREAMYGATRFEELVARSGLTETTTARKLRDLVTAGLLVKRPYREPGQRRRDEYVLTDAGTDLMPALMALLQWGNAHDTPPYPPELRHVDCGEPVVVEARCAAGHRVGLDDLVVSTDGPFGLQDPRPADEAAERPRPAPRPVE